MFLLLLRSCTPIINPAKFINPEIRINSRSATCVVGGGRQRNIQLGRAQDVYIELSIEINENR